MGGECDTQGRETRNAASTTRSQESVDILLRSFKFCFHSPAHYADSVIQNSELLWTKRV
jgi:hypothetical protein